MDPRALNAKRGRGFGSRLLVPCEALPEGWRFEKHSDKYCVWFDENGQRYKSSKEVEAVLRERGILGTGDDTETETETSEYEPSPEKRPKTGDNSCG